MKFVKSVLCAASLALWSGIAHAGTVALFSDVNMFNGYTAGGNGRVLTNLLDGGSKVLVSSSPGYQSVGTSVQSHYTSLSGVTATRSTGTLSSSLLSGVDLLFLDMNFGTNPGYNTTERNLIRDFITGGGNVGITMETGNSSVINSYNSFLSLIGLSMRVNLPQRNAGFQNADTILSTSLTNGVTSFRFAYNNPITGGTAAIRDGGATLVAFQTFADPTPPPPPPTPSTVPLPAAGWMLIAGLAGLTTLRRRKKA